MSQSNLSASGSDFPFYLGGAEKVVYFSRKVFLDRKTAAEREAQGKRKAPLRCFLASCLTRGMTKP